MPSVVSHWNVFNGRVLHLETGNLGMEDLKAICISVLVLFARFRVFKGE